MPAVFSFFDQKIICNSGRSILQMDNATSLKTELGKKAVFAEIERLKELVLNGEKLTGGWNK